jgi:hypothetical protein
MSEFVVLVPSRGRPESAARLSEAFRKTTSTTEAQLSFILDKDDPSLNEYYSAIPMPYGVHVVDPGTRGIVHPLNQSALIYSYMMGPGSILGFMGDDHLPKTWGWDEAIWDAILSMGGGFAYGNDLLQGQALPTACFMSTEIVIELGFMAPPVLNHLYVDNFWRDMGNAIGRLKYLPDVIIEHLHFSTGASPHDETYQAANDANISHDRAAYNVYLQTMFATDREKLVNLLR